MRLPLSAAEEGELDLTPVIDVVFLLLIFFLVASRFDQQERELKIALPEVVSAQPLSMTEDLVINILEDGQYQVLQKIYNKDELDALLAQASQKNPGQKALIRGDGRVHWRFVADAAARCDKYRIKHKESVLQQK